MKIDEAISILKQYIDYNNPDIPDFYTMEEACEVVIKALEQEPCDDAISRQYLVEKAVSWDKHFTDSERYVSLTDIQNAPPVTPAEKVGQ